MIFITLLLFLCLFIFTNPLYVAISLILSSLCLISKLNILSSIHPLVGFLVLAVYIGAIMILIGYVCAVCPNPNLDSSPLLFFILTPFLIFFILTQKFSFSQFSSPVSPLDYFYSPSGVAVLLFVVFFLFVVFLMVTSHFVTPQAPFRSSNDF